MQPGQDSTQARCLKCQAPLSQSMGRCPFCGTEIGLPDGSRPFEPAVVGMTDQHRSKLEQGRARRRKKAKTMGAAVFAAAALLLIAVGGTAAFFLIQKPALRRSVQSAAPTVADPPELAPLNIHGVVLTDGPKVDPTDIIHLVRSRVRETNPGAVVQLMGIEVHRARLGQIDLEDPEAHVRYVFLVTRRDPRAAKAKERSAERVEFVLSSKPPAVKRSQEAVGTTTVPEPLCVWSAAWRAAIASGVSEKEYLEVSYGLDEKRQDPIWTFEAQNRPESLRKIDGRSCAIKIAKPALGR